MENIIKHIVIVGGGTAGWLTAGIIAAEHKTNSPEGIKITLIESPDVNPIGVGEGTWPTMRSTLQNMGISEADFLTQCSGSFKQGSKFVGWKNGQENDFYYHPFTAPNGYAESNLVLTWLARWKHISFADAVCEQSQLCESGLAPKQKTTPEYAAVVNYGYHLDAGKFSQLLQKHCTENLGVTHMLDHVTAISATDNGDIKAVETKNAGPVCGDLFIDCTGTSCLLLGKHYQIPFIDQKAFSPNDRAIAVQVPYDNDSHAIASPTIATAQQSGWTWDIGLSSRRGVGYVYSSAHTNDDAAERTLRDYIANTGGKNVDSLTTRKLTIEAGHREKFWHKNCVAVGMAAGFIEPLEASALALVEMSANMIKNELPKTRIEMDIVAKRFNERFEYRWARVVEFLKLHYVLSQRKDSDYWRDVANPTAIPERLGELLSLWRHRPPIYGDFFQTEEIFPFASYQYVLYGMGFETTLPNYIKRSDHPEAAMRSIETTINRTRKFMSGLPSNRELLNHIAQHGMQKI